MPIPKTKLRPPTLRQSIVPRPRLTSLFADRRPLTLVSAPAGSGKTTLAVEWLASNQTNVAWLSLDADDNDPIRFINGFIAALQSVRPKLHAPSGQRDLNRVITEIINQLEDGEPVTVVLDDYHLITEDSIHSLLTYLLDHLPTSLQLAVVTRETPPLPFARLRARGQLCEIHLEDLRFTIAETTEFLNHIMGLNLSTDRIRSLEQYTQGWAAGLQMAGISLQANQKSHIPKLSEQQFITEYLLTEVFNHQPREVQSFLLNTSILDKFSAAVCKTIYSGNANRMLSRIEESNLFITKVDSWYQYHPLFREFLQMQLQEKFPDRIPGLHLKACQWLEQNGFIPEAIPHAFANSDDEIAARLIAALAPDYFKRGELATLRRWLDRLPESVIWNHPRLCMTQVWLLLDSNLQLDAQTYFDRLGSFLEKNLRGEFLAVRALHAAMTHQPELALKFIQQAQRTPEAKDPFIQTYVSFGLGAAQKMGLKFFEAEQSFRNCLSLADADGNSYIAVASLYNLTDVLYLQARLREAELACKDALNRFHESAPDAGDWYWTLSRIAYQRNELGKALRFINHSIDLCVDSPEKSLHARVMLHRALVHYALVKKNSAQADLDSADGLARGLQDQIILRSVTRQRVLFAVDDGDLPSARRWLKTLEEHGEQPFPFYYAFAKGRVLLAERKYKQANAEFALASKRLEEVSFVLIRIEVLIWHAICLNALAGGPEAAKVLQTAVELSQPERLIRPFIEARAGLTAFIAKNGGREFDWLADQLNRNRDQAREDVRSAPDGPDLTRREKEILQLLADGLSNQEMAEKLFIAEGTLKRHVANLYQKLGAHNRAQAIRHLNPK